MKVLLFGISNVGKSTTGKIIAEKLNYKFYDLDDEVKKYFCVTLEEFVESDTLKNRDYKRGKLIKEILKKEENLVLAVSPMSYTDSFKECLKSKDVLSIYLADTAENIFDRLVFSDEFDNIYMDNEYKSRYKKYYLREINEDLIWYGEVFAKSGVTNVVFIENESQNAVAKKIIDLYDLK